MLWNLSRYRLGRMVWLSTLGSIWSFIVTDVRVGRRLIYGIIDPRSQTLIYVGKTHKRRENRLGEHVENANEGLETPVYESIRAILRAGVEPIIFVLRRLPPEADWRKAERDEINKWRSMPSDQLPVTHEPQTSKSIPILIMAVDLMNIQGGG